MRFTRNLCAFLTICCFPLSLFFGYYFQFPYDVKLIFLLICWLLLLPSGFLHLWNKKVRAEHVLLLFLVLTSAIIASFSSFQLVKVTEALIILMLLWVLTKVPTKILMLCCLLSLFMHLILVYRPLTFVPYSNFAETTLFQHASVNSFFLSFWSTIMLTLKLSAQKIDKQVLIVVSVAIIAFIYSSFLWNARMALIVGVTSAFFLLIEYIVGRRTIRLGSKSRVVSMLSVPIFFLISGVAGFLLVNFEDPRGALMLQFYSQELVDIFLGGNQGWALDVRSDNPHNTLIAIFTQFGVTGLVVLCIIAISSTLTFGFFLSGPIFLWMSVETFLPGSYPTLLFFAFLIHRNGEKV